MLIYEEDSIFFFQRPNRFVYVLANYFFSLTLPHPGEPGVGAQAETAQHHAIFDTQAHRKRAYFMGTFGSVCPTVPVPNDKRTEIRIRGKGRRGRRGGGGKQTEEALNFNRSRAAHARTETQARNQGSRKITVLRATNGLTRGLRLHFRLGSFSRD